MYATAARYLNLPVTNQATKSVTPISITPDNPVSESYTADSESTVTLNWKMSDVQTSDPSVWGPAFWFSLHVSAAYYPVEPSDIVKERMKQRILAIPYEVPCPTCRPHASAFIESYRVGDPKFASRLDRVVSGRDELIKFYVDFHNKVNERYGKRQWTYDEAKKVYSGKARVRFLQ